MIPIKKTLIWLGLLGYSFFLPAQSTWQHHFLFHSGKIVKNYPTFPRQNVSFVGEYQLTKSANGIRAWHQYLHHPDVGVALLVGALGNTRVFGHFSGFMPVVRYRLKHSLQFFTLGLGGAYFDTFFDLHTNPENIFIGSPVTYLAKASWHMQWNLKPNWFLSGGISVLHASNGHYRMPNNGINLILASLGLSFQPTNILLPDTFPNRTDTLWHVMLEGGGGIHDFGDGTSPWNGPLYHVITLHGGVSKFVFNSGRLLLGVTFTYYSDFYDYMVFQNWENATCCYATTISTYLGYDIFFGRFAFSVESGILWWNPFYKQYKTASGTKGIINHLKYYINNRLGIRVFPFGNQASPQGFFMGAYIRANFGQADFNEISAGWLF